MRCSVVEDSVWLKGVLSSTSLLTLVRCPATRAEVTRLFGQLQSAIKHRNGDEARRLVDQGAGFDGEGNVLKAGAHMYFPGDNTVVDKEPGNTMLHLAIREGLSGLALHLISRNVDLNSCSDNQRTPLMMAILKKQSRVIEALLHAGVSISTCDYLGNTALAYALKANDDELAAKLVSLATPSGMWPHDFAGLVPLGWEAGRHGCGTDALTGCEANLVLLSCACGFPLTAQALLAIGVGHTGTDQFGRTALHYAHNLSQAVYAGSRTALIEMLLQKGANVDARDACGNLPAAGVQDPPPENQESSESYLMQLARWRLQKRLQVLASTRQILCKMAFCHAMEDVP